MRKAAEIWPVASFLREELRARRWSWADLALRMRCRQGTLARIRVGKPLTHYGAAGLARAFGTSVQFWLRLEAAFQASLKRELDEAGHPQERPEVKP